MVILQQVLQDMGLPTGAEQKVAEPVRAEETAASEEDTKPVAAPAEADTATATAKPEATDTAEVRPTADLCGVSCHYLGHTPRVSRVSGFFKLGT